MKKTLKFLKSVVLVLVIVCIACLIAGYASQFFPNSESTDTPTARATNTPISTNTVKPSATATLAPTTAPTEAPTPIAQIIYADDEGIQEYFALYNTLHPESPITASMLTKYYHHGQIHDDQVKFMLDGIEILVSNESGMFSRDGHEISIYVDNPDSNNDRIKQLFFMFMRIFDQSLSDATLENTWKRLTTSGSSNIEKIGNIECLANISLINNAVGYMKIEGTIPNPNSK